MNDLISTLLAALVIAIVFGSFIRGYTPAERPLLYMSLFAHLASGAAMTPITEHLLGGGDMLLYGRIGTALLDRLSRAPEDTAGVLFGLLAHSGNPLPVPDFGYAIGSSGAMIALTTIALLVTNGSLYAVCVIIAGFSFFAKVAMYDVFRSELDPRLHRRVLAATVLVPSVIFWSSGLIKEAFAVIGLGVAFKQLYRFYRGWFSPAGMCGAVAGLALVATTKGYVLVPLGVAAGASVLFARSGSVLARPGSLARGIVVLATSVFVVLGAGVVSSRYDPGNVIDTTAQLQDAGELVSGGSNYSLVTNRSLAGQLFVLPLVLGTALFRPAIVEAKNAQMAANGLEMAVFTVLVLRTFRRKARGYGVVRDHPVLVFSSVFSLVMAIGVGLASTNLGTLSRYRIPMMPFLWVLATVVASVPRAAVAHVIVGGRSNPAPEPRAPSHPVPALPVREGPH